MQNRKKHLKLMTGKQTVKKIWRVISDMQTRKENQKKRNISPQRSALEKLCESEISLPPKWNFQLIFALAYILTIASRNFCRYQIRNNKLRFCRYLIEYNVEFSQVWSPTLSLSFLLAHVTTHTQIAPNQKNLIKFVFFFL